MKGDDLYSVLGVDKAADDATIKKAYRKRARKAHPDRGGSTAEMTAINHAYAVLSDAKRRLHYDASGEDAPQASIESTAYSLVSEAFRAALAEMHKDASRAEPLAFATGYLGKRMMEKERERKEMQKAVAFLTKQQGKVKRRNRKGPDIYASLLEVEIRQLSGAIAATAQRIEELARAIEMLRDDYMTTSEPSSFLNITMHIT